MYRDPGLNSLEETLALTNASVRTGKEGIVQSVYPSRDVTDMVISFSSHNPSCKRQHEKSFEYTITKNASINTERVQV